LKLPLRPREGGTSSGILSILRHERGNLQDAPSQLYRPMRSRRDLVFKQRRLFGGLTALNRIMVFSLGLQTWVR
jgi:hypothetical protein